MQNGITYIVCGGVAGECYKEVLNDGGYMFKMVYS